ncbi:hypothetical protein B0H66DRAFT_587875 [Apodospora peruviana]|uniref:Uncharacterized protein n=1 Tax=Apodospora peruviana TaxID=516989 RepID=A0AAE0IH43_9PEZI|nr:hypothetical protein B0H66DRAFT_587875 [Apodospora peruviana]
MPSLNRLVSLAAMAALAMNANSLVVPSASSGTVEVRSVDNIADIVAKLRLPSTTTDKRAEAATESEIECDPVGEHDTPAKIADNKQATEMLAAYCGKGKKIPADQYAFGIFGTAVVFVVNLTEKELECTAAKVNALDAAYSKKCDGATKKVVTPAHQKVIENKLIYGREGFSI